jgi:hypothetical protein
MGLKEAKFAMLAAAAFAWTILLHLLTPAVAVPQTAPSTRVFRSDTV